MSRYVLDASVVVKWYVPEVHWLKARGYLGDDHDLVGPDILPVEVTHALLKKMRRGEIDESAVRRSVINVQTLVRVVPSISLLADGLDIAFRYQRSIYDSLYVALALQEACHLVTADRRLYDALAPSLPEALLWIEDVPV